MHNSAPTFFLKPACTTRRWCLTTVRTRAWLWPKARRPCFVAFSSLYMQVFVFEKWFCTLTFLKILYFLRSHCQLSFAIYLSSLYGVLTQSSKDFIAILNLRWNLFILYVFVSGGGGGRSEWRTSGTETGSSLLQTLHTWHNLDLLPGHPAICGFWYHSLFQGNEIIYVYSFVLYLYIALCFLAPNVLLVPYTLFILSVVQYQSSCQVVSMLILMFFFVFVFC